MTGPWPLRQATAPLPEPEASGIESRELSRIGGIVAIFGLNLDALLPIGLLVGWIVVMRFILPRLGIST